MDALEQYLLEQGIELAYPGHKNVSDKCVYAINCPYCSDKNFHLGIFVNNKGFSCFRCKTKGSVFKLLHDLFSISFTKYKELIDLPIVPEMATSEHLRQRLKKGKPAKNIGHKSIIFPSNAFYGNSKEKTIGLKLVKQFFKNRKNPISMNIIDKYGLYPCLKGEYKRRLIIPINDIRGIRKAFQARDLTGKSIIAYKNPSEIEIKDYLYGIDEIKKDFVNVVEGVTDKWRIGKNTVATFGVGLSSSQIELLLRKGIKKLILAWDYDAYAIASKTARELQPLFEKIKVLDFPFEQDPDLFGRKETYDLIRKTNYFGF